MPEIRSVIERVVNMQETVQEVLTGLTKLAVGADQGLDRLSDSMNVVAASQRRLLEVQQATDERINALIEVVDGLVRNSRVTLPSD